jgi:thiamine biosynthesis protein ThiS
MISRAKLMTLERLGWQLSAIAIAIDGCFLARHKWSEYTLTDGQELEVVSPMQGG